MSFLLIVALLLQDRYVVDPTSSWFSAKVEVGGVLSMFGHGHTVALRELSGEARFDPAEIEKSSLRMTIRAASAVEVGQEFSEEERKEITREIHEKALAVVRFPEIVFESRTVSGRQLPDGQYQIMIHGTLKLHGITRPVSIPVRLRVEGERLTARGTFTVRHSDYGIERLSAAAGTVQAKDDIVLTFHIVARRTP